MISAVDPQVAWTRQSAPDGQQLTRTTENLDAIILAVAHEDSIAVHPDTVRQVELTRLSARLTPRLNQLAVLRKAVNPRVAIAIRHVQLTIWCNCQPRRPVERPSAPLDGRQVCPPFA